MNNSLPIILETDLQEFLKTYNKEISGFYSSTNIESQEQNYEVLKDICENYSKVNNTRIVLTIADGTVCIDTGKPFRNTYFNFRNKIINENHNTRAPFINAINSNALPPLASESKLSNSTGNFEYRSCLRVSFNSGTPQGVIAFSKKI